MKTQFFNNYVIVEVEGNLSLSSIKVMYRSLLRHPQHKDGMSRIWLLGDATIRDMSKKDLAAVLSIGNNERNASRIKVATVAPNDVDYGLCRMAQAISNGERKVDYGVFRSLKEAQQWIVT